MDTQGTSRAWDGASGTTGTSGMTTSSDTDNASLGVLFRDLANDLSSLTRKELELARTETMEKVSHASKAVISMAAGGFLAYAGLLVLLAAAVMVVATWVPYWLSATIVGGVVLIIGVILLQSGRSALKKTNITPEKTVDSMKENAQWVKEKIQ
jgi:uncharacterized membrane protein YqjE